MKRFIDWIKSSSSDRFLLLVAVILLNLVSARAFLRFDLTSQKAFSLSKASKDVVKHIESPLSVKVFFTKNLPAPYNNVEQYLTDLLSEYKSNSSKYFSYQVFDMSKQENQEQAHNLGIYPVQIDQVETSGFSSKIAWMGIAITYGDYIAAIDSLKTTKDIEYKITTTISKIINAQDNNRQQLYEVGYITGHGEHALRSNPYADAFACAGCLEEISLPDQITEIPEYCFYGCESLRKIHLPEQLREIGESAFHDCEKLSDLNVPETLNRINPHAFAYCDELPLEIENSLIQHSVNKRKIFDDDY